MNPPAGPGHRTSRSEAHDGGAVKRKELPPEGRSRKRSGNKSVDFLMMPTLTIGDTHSYTSLQKCRRVNRKANILFSYSSRYVF